MSFTPITHIQIDKNGIAWIDDTNVKAVEVALDKLAHGSSPEEMHFQFPSLSLAQIHAALAYYYDHQEEMDLEIERQWEQSDDLAQRISNQPLRNKLNEAKRRG